MSRSYTSSPPLLLHGVLWDCFTFYSDNLHIWTLVDMGNTYVHITALVAHREDLLAKKAHDQSVLIFFKLWPVCLMLV
jgi:hypothetical protein